jgi:hypothetical protein
MSIQVTGILKNPIQQLSKKTTIRIVSKGGNVLISSPASVVTDRITAAYDFPLEEGTFSLEVLYSGEYALRGDVTITGSTASPLTLEELFALAV